MSLEETNKRIAGLEMKLSKAKRAKQALEAQSITLIEQVNAALKIWKRTIKTHAISYDETDENCYALYIYPQACKGQFTFGERSTLTTEFNTLEEYRAAKCDWDPVIFYARTREVLVPNNWETLWLLGMTFFVFKVGTEVSPVESDYERRPVDSDVLYYHVNRPIPIYITSLELAELLLVDFASPASVSHAFVAMRKNLRGTVAAIPKIKDEVDDKLAEIDRINKKTELDVFPFV